MNTPKPDTQQLNSSHNFTHHYHIGLSATGIIYLCGYLINQIYLRNLGIESASLLRTQYIETGLVFIFLVAMTIFLPYFAIILSHEMITKRTYGSGWQIMFGFTFLLRISFGVIFFLVLLFTDSDWNSSDSLILKGWTLRKLFSFYFPMYVIGSFIIAKIERFEDSLNFREEEFNPPFSIEKLCAKIDANLYGLSLSNNDYTIDTLNEILTIPDFYDILCKIIRNNVFSNKIKKLIEKTAKYRKGREFSCMQDSEKRNIKELNRGLLEETFPDFTPKIRENEWKNLAIRLKKLLTSIGRGMMCMFTGYLFLILFRDVKWTRTLPYTLIYYLLVSALISLIFLFVCNVFKKYIKTNKNKLHKII